MNSTQNDFTSEELANLNLEKQQLLQTAEELRQHITDLNVKLGSIQQEVGTLHEDKMQLKTENQELRVAQMENAVSGESKNLADSVLNEVQMSELKKTNEALSTDNLSLADDLRATMDQLTTFKNQIKEIEQQKAEKIAESESFLSQLKQQQAAIAQLKIELEQARQKPQEISGNSS